MTPPSARVLFLGTPDFAVPILAALLEDPRAKVCAVITQPDRPSGRGHKLSPPPIKSLALKKGIAVFQPQSIRREFGALEKQLAEHGPFDLGVVVAFGQILPKEVLSYPRLGCINLHGSILPRWRGAAPMQRAIMSQDRETGICLMQMDEGLDTGAVLAESRTPLSPSETLGSLHDRLAKIGATLLIEQLDALLNRSLPLKAQPEVGIAYAHKIKPEEALINWKQEASTVSAAIRGLSPFPGAYTFWKGQRLKIFMALKTEDASSQPASPQSTPPGTVTETGSTGIEVRCLQGSVVISELQLEGKRRMDAGTFLHGIQLAKDDVLGNLPSS